ncbi:MAG: hypothetical protein OER88_01715 [Planctomycetota bacterium]|nr:hypothetical protein [Planctomycetota bacterium]
MRRPPHAMTALTIAIVAGFSVLLLEGILGAVFRRRAIRRYARWWVSQADDELTSLETTYTAAIDEWTADLAKVEAATGEIDLEANVHVQRPILPSIGPALLGVAQHLPDEVTQKLTFVETLIADLGQDARDLLRSTDQWATDVELGRRGGGEAQSAAFKRVAGMMINHYRRTLLVADGARKALDAVKAHPMFRTN